MPRLRPALIALVLTATTPVLGIADAPEIPDFAKQLPPIKSGEPIFRFNGKNLDGFYTYLRDSKYDDPKKVFTVQDGMIRVSGEEFGGFITKETFKDYHLIVEWKWGDETFPPRKDRARDSGILLHCVGPDGAAGGNWMQSVECQVIEGGCGDFIMVAGQGRTSLTCEVRVGPDKQLYYQKGGMAVTRDRGRFNWWGRDPAWKDVLGFRGRNDVEKPAGEWNRMEVLCDGDTITNIVNGYVVNVGTKSSLTEGKILFQSEGAEIFFRKIEVRPLVK
ncbi:MAG: DUF1080 domain-containing protein [Isosphaeraceae bacterium]|nr:DUF1080 domain-containing protein [Isosphaeraceae bacterium]